MGRAPARRGRRPAAPTSAVDGIDCADGRIAGVTVDHHGTRETVTADHYVAAMPVEQLRPLLSPALVAAEPRLAATRRLRTRWMNGVMFYLHHDVPILAGPHDLQRLRLGADLDLPAPVLAAHRLRAAWATGHVGGVLSVDVSDWERPSRRTGKVASKCSADEIKAEVWAQLKDAPQRPARTSSSTTPTSRAPSSTRTSRSPTRARPRTPSRCSSTPPGRGPTGPTR